MTYAAAKRLFETVTRRFEQFGFPLVFNKNVIVDGDDSTLFCCSGMQPLKQRFQNPDGSHHGSLQSCIRTKDLDMVGDGTHLTYFEMLGNFSFGGNDYEHSVELWHCLLRELGIQVDHITVHPSQQEHLRMWQSRGYRIVPEPQCEWSDGNVGGHCCEVFSHGVEIGNLVNPLGHSTDVGFGWERMLAILEGKTLVHETDLFRQDVPPFVSDHLRTLNCLWLNGIKPGGKGRNYVCRRLCRRILDIPLDPLPFDEWLGHERSLREQKIRDGRRCYRKFRDKPKEFWWETFGILPEEMRLLE